MAIKMGFVMRIRLFLVGLIARQLAGIGCAHDDRQPGISESEWAERWEG
jgi:hypothetical protein